MGWISAATNSAEYYADHREYEYVHSLEKVDVSLFGGGIIDSEVVVNIRQKVNCMEGGYVRGNVHLPGMRNSVAVCRASDKEVWVAQWQERFYRCPAPQLFAWKEEVEGIPVKVEEQEPYFQDGSWVGRVILGGQSWPVVNRDGKWELDSRRKAWAIEEVPC